MSYALCLNLKTIVYFLPSERDRDFVVVCFLSTSGQLFFSRASGKRLPHIAGLRVNSVIPGWVGAPNERALFRFHDAIAVFADRMSDEDSDRRPGFGGGVHEHCAGFESHAIKLRVSCPGE